MKNPKLSTRMKDLAFGMGKQPYCREASEVMVRDLFVEFGLITSFILFPNFKEEINVSF